MYRWKFLNSIVEDVHHHLDTTTHFLLSNKTRKSLKCGRNPERFRMVRWSRKYQSGKWTLPLLAWCTSADPAVERSGIRDDGREKYTAPSLRGSIFQQAKNWQAPSESELSLSDRLSGGVIQRLGTRVRFPGGRTRNTFGFLAQTDEQVELGGWENLALVATVD